MAEPTKTHIPKSDSWKMFDEIAPTYDITNRVLSMRQDVLWRKKLAKLLPQKQNLDLLDLATGTADQILFLLEETSQIATAIGADLSEGMLEVGRKKIQKLKLEQKVKLVTGDACHLPFESHSFDAVTMSFGIRNVPDVQKALNEIFRVTRSGGKALILEFSLPKFRPFKNAYLFYFRNILPRLGGIISGQPQAYKYLNVTVEDFPYGDEFAKMLTTAGFQKVSQHPLTFGIATIYEAEKK